MPNLMSNLLRENLAFIILLVIAGLFAVFKSYQLIIGTIFFLYLAILSFKESYEKDERSPFVMGFLYSIITLMTLFAALFLPKLAEVFVFVVLLLVILSISFYIFVKDYFSYSKQFLALIFILIIFVTSIPTMKLLMNSLALNKGITNIMDYLSVLAYGTILILALFIIINFVLLLLGKKNNYLSIGLALTFLVLIGGYFYMLESKNQLRDILIIISGAFFTSFSGVAAFKKIIEKNS
jgi:hypothetical protein